MRKFRNINKTVRTDTDNFFAVNPNQGDFEERLAKRTTWVRSASRAYGVPAPAIHVSNRAKRGFYRADGDGCIVLPPNMSIISMFRQFRKHCQNRGVPGARKRKTDSRGWAHALYKSVRPNLYAELVSLGRIRP